MRQLNSVQLAIRNSRLCTKGGMVATVTSHIATTSLEVHTTFCVQIGGKSRVACECVVSRGQSSFGQYEHFARFWRRGTIDCMPLYAQACNATFSARLRTTLWTSPLNFEYVTEFSKSRLFSFSSHCFKVSLTEAFDLLNLGVNFQPHVDDTLIYFWGRFLMFFSNCAPL